MLKKITVFLIVFLIWHSHCSETEENNEFVATKEWQVVKKGQKIPKGLHVRINFETGVTEAKLLDDSPEDKDKALLHLPEKSNSEEKIPTRVVSQSELNEIVKNIKDDDILNPDEIKKIKDKFRSYDDLKKSLGELNLTPKIDSEVIEELLHRHNEAINRERIDKTEIVTIIEDLDFLAHQYDNAIEFVNQNGFSKIIYKNLNSTNVDIRKDTLKLMGSLMQNNNKPKIHALETGAIGVLLRIINFDSDAVVKSRALTALSSLLRSFPIAQQKFVENGGFSVMAKIFENDDIKLQIKAVTMISDLISEHHWAIADDQLKKYYTSFDLQESVLEYNWCEHLNILLHRLLVTDKEDHDAIEKCLTAMHSLRTKCGSKYEKSVLTNLQKRYATLAELDKQSRDDEISNAGFFSVLKNICDEILSFANNRVLKTEL